MSTTSDGMRAEQLVSKYMEKQGYKKIDTNWRRRDCEIDLVMERRGCIYFTEVKYRSGLGYGDGISYITSTKLRKMTYAASRWVQESSYEGDYTLMAASVDKDDNITLLDCSD